MKHLAAGILAHVDAGKTTLSEALLYQSGAIKKLGRVDHQDAFLDTQALERQRGITIFSKQAVLPLAQDLQLHLLDTPGHVDFSAEAERTLQVLDFAVLVISGTDGVQAHTETLWQLLHRYQIPTFLFVNKMDLPGANREALRSALQSRLGAGCVDMAAPDWAEQAALCDEQLMEAYLAGKELPAAELRRCVARRKLFPCYFGSALKLQGICELLQGMAALAPQPEYPAEFAARVFKISRSEQGERLTWLKVTGGSLQVRSLLHQQSGGEHWEEKVNQLRVYSGAKYTAIEKAEAGSIVAVTGPEKTWAGQALGSEPEGQAPALEPVLTCRVLLPEGCDARVMLQNLRQLQEEDPQLHIVWQEALGEIHLRLMGEVQLEVLQSVIETRFGVRVAFGPGSILYRETIAAPVEGVGHFEPLRHYAEVHLLLKPAPRGSGLHFESACSEDKLDRNWQRLILTHLEEKEHLGCLTGSPITDIKITLVAGRAHAKHTEGGDFRQATYRAVRQGLMQAESVLLEPYYAFRLTVPSEQIGRAISDVRAMSGTFSAPETQGDLSVLAGTAPVACMRDYASEVAAYTRGRGRLMCSVEGYAPCHNAASVIAESGYDPARDTENPADSVFCSHGAGTVIPWDKVRDYMHIDTGFGREETAPAPRMFRRNFDLDDRELEAIMEREFGPIRRREYRAPVVNQAPDARAELFHPKRERLIVDGYNVIFAWDELKPLAAENLDVARQRLMDMLSNYAGFTRCELVLVFDGYRVRGGRGERFDYHNIHVAYTKENETADAYIEKLADEIGKNESVRVVTSDNLIRLSALRAGVLRTSAMEFRNEVAWIGEQIDAAIRDLNGR